MDPPGSWLSPIKREQQDVDLEQMPDFSQFLREEKIEIEMNQVEQDMACDMESSIPLSRMGSLPQEIIEQYTSLILPLMIRIKLFYCGTRTDRVPLQNIVPHRSRDLCIPRPAQSQLACSLAKATALRVPPLKMSIVFHHPQCHCWTLDHRSFTSPQVEIRPRGQAQSIRGVSSTYTDQYKFDIYNH